MSAKDRFHQVVKTALIKDGWIITHDPRPYAQETIKESQTSLLVYDPDLEVISQWIS